jgi:PEP-CTERM motif
MHDRNLVFLSLCTLLLMSAQASANPTVTLSSPSNLSDLQVGQTVEIDVTLSGLAVGSDFIFNFNTKVLFNSSLFQAIPNPGTSSGLTAVVAPGSVFDNNVQGPLQIANFDAQSSLTAGAANGIFSQSPNPASGAIGLNGLYYSFDLKAISAGSGSILFDPTPGANQYAADDTGFNFAPLPNTGPLEVSISAVPEPTSIAMLGIGVATLAYWTLARRRAAV